MFNLYDVQLSVLLPVSGRRLTLPISIAFLVLHEVSPLVSPQHQCARIHHLRLSSFYGHSGQAYGDNDPVLLVGLATHNQYGSSAGCDPTALQIPRRDRRIRYAFCSYLTIVGTGCQSMVSSLEGKERGVSLRYCSDGGRQSLKMCAPGAFAAGTSP